MALATVSILIALALIPVFPQAAVCFGAFGGGLALTPLAALRVWSR